MNYIFLFIILIIFIKFNYSKYFPYNDKFSFEVKNNELKDNLISKYFNNSEYEKINYDWKQYKRKFKKYFKNSSEESIHKMEFFNIQNIIKKHNELFKKVNQNEDTRLFGRNISVPLSIDWREHNRVSPIQNQKDCGSCWIFAANSAIEGAYAKKTGNLYSFSVQQVADCTYGNSCDGGWMTTAYRYGKIRGLTTTQEYPYIGKDSKCNLKGKKIFHVIKKWINLSKNEERLKKVVGTIGPVAVAIDASLLSFKNYKSGIYDDPLCTNNLDHAVLIIGYGIDPVFGKYWIVKNSWGTSWGEKGYFKIKRGVNQCGIGEVPSYPIA
ncbi:Cathepsin L.1 [Strongyloides ratti]|uniref:Cathepsin L.1 n=1 Tax=Strongyloides ratti TaxID=34506 RepID=A0A090KU49_STRRB|nr:Cathepsin L.1 [Strongyloides ratti]CEF60946.1 Cathepsin L.1 [Strongyloides ratti]